MEKNGILTPELIEEAISYCLPTIRLLVQAHTWGPKGVVISVSGPGFFEAPTFYNSVEHVMAELGEEAQWANQWEGKNFRKIAIAKMLLARSARNSTRKVVEEHPWLLRKGDYFYPGGVYEAGLAVGVSGSHGDTDEAIAWIVVNAIWLLCQRQIHHMQEKNIKNL